MIAKLIESIFGSKHDRDIKRISPLVDEINRIFATLRDKENRLAKHGRGLLE